MRLFLPKLALGCTLSWVVAQANDSASDHIQAIADWLRSEENGYFSDKVEIRRADPSDPNSHLGMFATSDISAQERLLHIPKDSLIRVESSGRFIDDMCDLAKTLTREMQLGDDSEYAPFVKYLQTKQHGQIPSTWTLEAQELLKNIIGYGLGLEVAEIPTSLLPPEQGVNLKGAKCGWNFAHRTKCASTSKQEHAVSLVIQRGHDHLLTPIYDIINHNNIANVHANDTSPFTESVNVDTSRVIKAGEEIFYNYNKYLDDDTEFDDLKLGTPEIFRDFGFVEQYPQRWYFSIPDVQFELVEETGADGTPTLQLSWIDDKTPKGQGEADWFEEQYLRLADMLDTDIKEAQQNRTIPEKELNLILQYHEAISTAIAMAFKGAKGDKQTCSAGSCDENHNAIDIAVEKIDRYYSKVYQCETLTNSIDEQYDKKEVVKSQYQGLEYFEHPETKNACFHLDGVFQICESYWPHYHEMFVHKPAKYLKEVKRLLWVGGGDSGLVNEIVKYPSLELAVGLELDQKVTRGAFKFFGAKPHFDNEKVQWWFGDASKSLLMLPEEYFGSFDMVLVDLSDTVLAFSVSQHLDIFSALSLLLKPEGLYVMNELFFQKVSNVFEYTINYFFTDVPEIGDQSYMIGSNGVDFLNRALTEHDLEDLYVESSTYKAKHQFDMVHDYRRNHNNAFKKLCKDGGEGEDELNGQEASPGILMIIEAENVSADLASIGDVKNAVTSAVGSVGFEVLRTSALSPSEEAYDQNVRNIVLIMKEGYVVVRTWPEYNHCSFDIHLWSSFNQHEAAKKALIESVGGDVGDVTSYRIVAGGMFGVSTWKEDVESRGPKVTQTCEAPLHDEKDMSKMDEQSVAVAMGAGIGLVQDENAIVAVVCGYHAEPCDSIDIVQKHDSVKEVIPLYTCPGIKSAGEFLESKKDSITACTNDNIKILNESFQENDKRLHAVVLDRNAPKNMGSVISQILTRIFKGQSGAPNLEVAPQFFVLATVEQKSEAWRRNLLDTVRKQIIVADPVSGARVFFNTSDTSIEFHITSSGDELFFEHLTDLMQKVESETDLVVEVRNILGGLWKPEFIPNLEPWEVSKYMSPGDFDRNSSLLQWRSQQPLGYQTVFQLEHGERFKVGDKVSNVQNGVRFEGVVEAVDFVSDTYHVWYGDDDDDDDDCEDDNDDGCEDDDEDGEHLKMMKGFELKSIDDAVLPSITVDQIEDSLKSTLAQMKLENVYSANVFTVPSIGDGHVIVALWLGGTVVVLWDGRTHVDVNLFTYNESKEIADEFVSHFKQFHGYLNTALRDEQPRGKGSVVNFLYDIHPRADPRWV